MRSATFGARISIVATIAALAAACSGPAGGAAPQETFSGDVPEFTGPYATEFADHYRRATSDFVREALADEEISDAEYAEMTSRLSSCLADQGVTLESISPTEGMRTSVAPDPDDTHDIVDGCSTTSGEDSVGALRSFLMVNPNNLDVATLTADCLVRSGTVPSDYGADDFSADSASRFADLQSLAPELRAALVSCSEDPSGLLSSEGR